MLFAACADAGMQLLVVAVLMLLLFAFNPVSIERNNRLSTLIKLYSLFAHIRWASQWKSLCTATRTTLDPGNVNFTILCVFASGRKGIESAGLCRCFTLVGNGGRPNFPISSCAIACDRHSSDGNTSLIQNFLAKSVPHSRTFIIKASGFSTHFWLFLLSAVCPVSR